MKELNVLVTGGAGYIGSHCIEALRNAGFRPVVLDDLSTGFQASIPSGVELIEASILDREQLGKAFSRREFHSVVHLAAKTLVPESVLQPLEYYRVNTFGTGQLLEACVQFGIKNFLFSSTAAVYGTVSERPVSEQDQTNPTAPYGASKLFAERIVRDAATRHGMRFAILRYFNVAGASLDGQNGQRSHAATHLLKRVCEAALGRRSSVPVCGTDYSTEDGTGVRDFIHVEDLADLHSLILQKLVRGSDSLLLNCGYGRGYSVRQVVSAMSKVVGSPVPMTEHPRREGDVASVVADTSLLKSTLDWSPRCNDLEVICRTAYEWEKSQPAKSSL